MKKQQKIIVLGTREFAEEVADLIDECPEFKLDAFAENYDKERSEKDFNGYPVIWVDDLKNYTKSHKVVCAIGTTKRYIFVDQAAERGLSFARIIHPTSRVSGKSIIGEGAIISAGVIIAAHTTLGNHVIVNRGSLIGHHTNIGNYVTISPGSNIAGRVNIGDGSYIGMGAIILNDIKIGSNSVVGAGSVVTKDVPDNTQVLGIPAKIVKTNIAGR